MARLRVAGVTPRSRRRTALAKALGILGVHNLVQNTVLNETGYVAGNLAMSVTLVGIARSSGASWDEMGLGRPDVATSSKIGSIAVSLGALGTIAAVAHPRTRALLSENRTPTTGSAQLVRRALIRFPLGTALFEEVAFRGVLPALTDRGNWQADAMSAAVFAVWHIIPTARAQASGADTSRRNRTLGIAIGSTAAGVAGLGLSWLRRRTGGLLAPWMVHASVNSIAFLAGAALRRRSAA